MRDPGGRRQERGEGKEGEVGLLWIRWPSQKVPLKMVVQAREGFGLASMGTLVSPAFVVFVMYRPHHHHHYHQDRRHHKPNSLRAFTTTVHLLI